MIICKIEHEIQIDTVEPETEVETEPFVEDVIKIESNYTDYSPNRILSPHPTINTSENLEKETNVNQSESNENIANEIRELYSCGICGQRFDNLITFKKHLKQYDSNRRVFQCGMCDKPFNQLSGLKTHINRVHLKLRPFECTECGKCFADALSLKLHLHTHRRGKRSYKCIECSKGFFTKVDLQQHLLTHGK